MFAADPERYAPQYDGYCAVSMSMGKKAEPDPEAWAIAEGKLYVFGVKRAVAVFAQKSDGRGLTGRCQLADAAQGALSCLQPRFFQRPAIF